MLLLLRDVYKGADDPAAKKIIAYLAGSFILFICYTAGGDGDPFMRIAPTIGGVLFSYGFALDDE